MLYEFLEPLPAYDWLEDHLYQPSQVQSQTYFYNGSEVDLDNFDIAIISVFETRGAKENIPSIDPSIPIRQELYQLFLPNMERPFRIIDLGRVRPGATLKDTYFGLASVLLSLYQRHVIPVIIGGSHDLTFGQYLSYQELYTLVNLVVVDERINITQTDAQPDAGNFLMHILSHSPNYLFNYSHLGYQTYFTDKNALDMLESLNFDCQRLGIIRSHMEETEPVLRDADMLSIDISAVRMADAPGHAQASPNGFSGEELCQIARYAGLSDKLSTIGFYEYNPDVDHRHQTSQLIAQAIWYFMEGFYNRRNDVPNEENMAQFMRFTVKLEQYDHELVFWKSKSTGRWWMELPYGDKKKYARHQMIPCSKSDYEMACKEEIPDRWMRVYSKLQEH
ncbi:MAG: formimidoylglutamase [Chitinophagales bacterium]